jgi:hypothetical protein
VFTAYQARLGTPVGLGRIFLSLVSASLGFESGPLLTSAVVA